MNTHKLFSITLKEQKTNLSFKLLFFLCFCFSQLALSSSVSEGLNGNLVSVEWLEKNIMRDDVLVIDASAAQMFAAQHIPSAINIDMMRRRNASVSETEKIYQSSGISPDKKVVIYDQGDPMMATRLFFDLYYNGFPESNLFVLDGGFSKWKESENSVSNKATPSPKKGSFNITKSNTDVLAKLPEFLTATGDQKNNSMVNALDAESHFGESQWFDRPGHMPNSTLLPTSDFYNEDKTFKSPDEIQQMLDYLGVKTDQHIYTYCGGGITASVPFFAIKFIMKYPNVKLYAGSELEWLQDKRELPFWTYDAPFLMRKTNWLKTWGGRMMRMYGVSQVSFVDVRPSKEFDKTHLPFALNVPSELFKRNLNNPEKLAEILGLAGVNPTHEAVVISGEGLSEHSALAYLMLKRLGHKQVSIFIDSFEQSAQQGFALMDTAAAVNSKKKQLDWPTPPVKYIAGSSREVMITDHKNTKGVYPKVFIASGKNIPAKVPEGSVVHLPYTDLLNTDGTAKTANDIWGILAKAGIPRYAELISFSDNPGEAAVNYFMLKLMGYPDVKVLVN